MSMVAKAQSLLYVSNAGTQNVTVYTYKNGNGLNLVGTLTGFPSITGICTDKSGNVYVPTSPGPHGGGEYIYKYQHGGTEPIATFKAHLGRPLNCAVDPKSGDLAVLNDQSHYYGMNITIWPKGDPNSQPTRYIEYGYNGARALTYDTSDNLYFDDGASGLYKLTGGSYPFTRISINGATLHNAGGMQWGNPNLLLGDYNGAGTSVAYQLRISGNTATVVGSVPFTGSSNVYGFCKVASKIVAADNGASDIGIYTFPGGSLVSQLSNDISSPWSAVISQ